MVERVNRSIQQMLKPHIAQNIENWDKWLWAVAQSYNSTVHASTGQTPFKLFLSRGCDPILPLDLIYGTVHTKTVCPVGYIEEMQAAVQEAFAEARQHLHHKAKVQATMHERGGLKIRTYRPGQRVWRYYPPVANTKLKEDWTGPYEILQQHNNNTVVMAPLSNGQVVIAKKMTVHVTCLKPVEYTRAGEILLASYTE